MCGGDRKSSSPFGALPGMGSFAGINLGAQQTFIMPNDFPFQPGPYQVLFTTPGQVTSTVDINSEQLNETLEVRQKLEIVEVQLAANRKIRGRIEKPVEGWVTIVDQGQSPMFPMLMKGEIPVPKARYKITFDRTAVTPDRDIYSEPKVGDLPIGKIVTVHQVASVKDREGNERIRGKIRRPHRGWITLAYPAQGFSWAELAKEEELGEYDRRLSRADFAEIYKQLSLLVQSGALDDDEEMTVYDMISQEDPKVVAAYRRYQKHNDREKFALDIKPDNSPPMTPEEDYIPPAHEQLQMAPGPEPVRQEDSRESTMRPYSHPEWNGGQQQQPQLAYEPQFLQYPPQPDMSAQYHQQQPPVSYPQSQPYTMGPPAPYVPPAPYPGPYDARPGSWGGPPGFSANDMQQRPMSMPGPPGMGYDAAPPPLPPALPQFLAQHPHVQQQLQPQAALQ
jgi:hypothetical protein